MKPYRDLFPHARLVLPNTEAVAKRVVVLPTGIDSSDIDVVVRVISALANPAR
jgi:hypothetical protein